MIEKIIKFKEISSTQDTAKRFAGQHEELAVSSLCQKRGRGRQGKTWFSPLGGLYLSLLLFPETHLTSIPFLASLSVIKALADFGFSKLLIHWPNDVLLNKKKVSGVICEQYKDAIICGIGINVNIEKFTKKAENATSMKLESGNNFDLDEVLARVIDRFNPGYEELQHKGLKVKEVLNYISGIGEAIEIMTPSETIKGTICDIDDDWALLLRDEHGMIRKFHYGDVRRLVW